MVKRKAIEERNFLDQDKIKDLKMKLKQLTDKSNLPEYMGELFLFEIKHSTDEANKHLRERAKLLGLM